MPDTLVENKNFLKDQNTPEKKESSPLLGVRTKIKQNQTKSVLLMFHHRFLLPQNFLLNYVKKIKVNWFELRGEFELIK